MLHTDHPAVRQRLLQGCFGLEKESLRVTADGYLAQTPHPFPNNQNIVRDFCENQTEINTPVFTSAHDAVSALLQFTADIQRALDSLPQREFLWPFSNPPYIRREQDIPIAQFTGESAWKTTYREYLSHRYGRYKMTLCGIHVNYSFSEELLRADFALSGETDFRTYRDQFYVKLAERAAGYSWILTSVTAASPLLDSSYLEKGQMDQNDFTGMASVRCSEMGYWNDFVPLLDYTNIQSYADSIQRYVDGGFLSYATELYYPVRLKPPGVNNLDTLREKGVSHIELRMFDLNPLAPAGIDERDVVFAQLLLIWLASSEPVHPFRPKDQVQAVQNFKNAARYDLKTVHIVAPDGEVCSVADAGLKVLSSMKEFYRDFPAEVQAVLDFEESKFVTPHRRYAWRIRRQFSDHFVREGLALAKAQQEELIHV